MTDDRKYGAIIIGGGHNGLVCAGFLARAGQSVLVVEAADRLGGAARNAEIAPGYTAPSCAHILHLLHPRVRAKLKLRRHGLKLAARRMPTVALDPDGNHLTLGGKRITGSVPDEDARSWRRLRKRLLRMAGALHPFLGRTPPRLGGESWQDRLTLARLGLSLRMLGKTEMRDFLRIVNMNAADLLDDELSDDRLKGALAFDAVLGTNFGPRSPGSVLTWLYRLAGEAKGGRRGLAIPEGGMGAVTEALAASALAFGADIRTGTPVRRIVVEGDRATAVELESGTVLRTRAVISSADPKTTFLDLVGPEHLDTGFLRRVRNFRTNGLAAKLNLALDELPEFTGLDRAALGGRLVIAPDIGYVERAFDHSKYGEYSAEPAIEITIPTVHDASLAPGGGHVLSAVVQYAPRDLKGGWDAHRDAFADHAVAAIARYAPGLAERIVERQVLTPADIEREFRITGGHWHHGDLAIDQMLMLRPVPGWAQYEAPVAGLYLCGAGAHPGGGVMGAAGMNAAQRILATRKGEDAA
ncbi:MAG: NAD(P)/FAD-dependent oxidoreductase [Alphaproteobacteria bacterium]|nr:NAD(P)/FAD-dependent oxidoreductase [Alphaproteobacteria bacterium]